jgi:phage/plasmid-like protein (TIGR03299 family)
MVAMSKAAIKYMQQPESIVQAEGEHDCLINTPWENLGARIPKNATVREMLDAAGLNWKVLRAESTLKFMAPQKDGSEKKITLANPKAFSLVRSSDHAILSPFIGPRYKEIQNDTAFEVFSDFVKAGHMTMETAGAFAGGRHIWGLASIGDGFELADGEIIKGYFLLLQSHQYGFALKAMFTPIRYPGGHTLVQNITTKNIGGKATYTMSHARKFSAERIKEIHEVVGIAHKALADFRGKAEFMAKMKVSEADAIFYLAQVFDPQLIRTRKLDKKQLPQNIEELLCAADAGRSIKKVARSLHEYPGHALSSCQNTAWGYYQAVTHAFDHTLGQHESTRVESSWFGKNRNRKQSAFDLATVLATQKGSK